MKHIIAVIVLSFGLQCGGCARAERAGTDIWSDFLKNSNDGILDTLVSQISTQVAKCGWGRTDNYVAVPSEIRQDLFDRVESGNEASLRAGLFVERCLDGGDLGDFRRSAGQFFEKKPAAFLQEMKHSSVSTARYESMVTMLPLTLVDNLDGQVGAIGHRIQLLYDIEAEQLGELKKAGTEALKNKKRKLIELQKSE